MRILVTGATGFVGPYLVRLLLSRRHEVIGTYCNKSNPELEDVMRLVRCDLNDGNGLKALLDDLRPERIYHLAGSSSVVRSYEDARAVYEINFLGLYNLLAAVRQSAPAARILVVGTGHAYGVVDPEQLPVTETHSFSSHSPYATSKAAADLLAFQFFAGYGLQTFRARPFNHTGPGQSPAYVCSDFAKQVAAIELGIAPPELAVGSLTIERDFSDVRDVVRAYELILEKGVAGEAYNISSGRSTSIGVIVEILSSFCSKPIKVVVKDERVRRVEEPKLYGSTDKLRQATGWSPEFTLEKTLLDLMEYWKTALRAAVQEQPVT